MSVPFNILFCSKCDAEWSTLILNGYFEYGLPDGRYISVGRCMGWCRTCGNVEAVECLPYKYDAIIRLHEADAGLTKTLSQLPTTLPQRLIWRFSKKRRNSVENEIKRRNVELRKCQTRVDFLALRVDIEKCLKCGSADITKFDDLPKFSSEEYRSVSSKIKITNYMHPVCGGKLYIRTSGGVRIAAKYLKRLYDVNGNLKRATFECD